MNAAELAIGIWRDSGGVEEAINTQELAIQAWEDEGGAITDGVRSSYTMPVSRTK